MMLGSVGKETKDISVVRKEGRFGGICGVRNVKILTEHLIVKVTEDCKIIRSFTVPHFHDFGVGGGVHALLCLLNIL